MQDIISQLQHQGYRLSQGRKLMASILRDASQPLSVADILDEMKRRKEPCHKTTVYRELEFFRRLGLAEETHTGSNAKRYEITSTDHHHHHLVCVECRTVEDITLSEHFVSEGERLAGQKHFKILDHALEFFGLCQKCRG